MAKNALVITLRSGRQIECDMDAADSDGKTPNECARIFHKVLVDLVSLQLYNHIVFIREIETVEFFDKEEPKTENPWTWNCSVCRTKNPVFTTKCAGCGAKATPWRK